MTIFKIPECLSYFFQLALYFVNQTCSELGGLPCTCIDKIVLDVLQKGVTCLCLAIRADSGLLCESDDEQDPGPRYIHSNAQTQQMFKSCGLNS